MRVNFSVTNQLATPSIHAAALANRPPAGQPGRLFVDTDNPSSGIYRDTGTVWENITGGAGAGNLQTVTDAGNTTDNNILLTYADNTLANALVFYNDQLAQEEYLIEKRGTGITTNDSLVIQSRGNISPSTNPIGIMIDGANDVVKSFYTTAYTELGLKLDFANQYYYFGDFTGWNNYTYFQINVPNNVIDVQSSIVGIGDVNGYGNGTSIIINDNNSLIKTIYQANDIGLKLDFVNWNYYLGDFDGVQNSAYIYCNNDTAPGVYAYSEGTSYMKIEGGGAILGDYANALNGTYLFVAPPNQIIYTQNNGNDIGLKLDFANTVYYFGDFNNIQDLIYCKADIGNGFFDIVSAQYVNFRAEGANVQIGDIDNFDNGTRFGVDDLNQKLTATTNLLVGSSGSSSGQHLKIKVGTTDYVIELKNP